MAADKYFYLCRRADTITTISIYIMFTSPAINNFSQQLKIIYPFCKLISGQVTDAPIPNLSTPILSQ